MKDKSTKVPKYKMSPSYKKAYDKAFDKNTKNFKCECGFESVKSIKDHDCVKNPRYIGKIPISTKTGKDVRRIEEKPKTVKGKFYCAFCRTHNELNCICGE